MTNTPAAALAGPALIGLIDDDLPAACHNCHTYLGPGDVAQDCGEHWLCVWCAR